MVSPELPHVNRRLHVPRSEAYAARQGGKRPKCLQDFRETLEDASVDAVVIATPPHWHALATILCCRAGKDVYCEKPQSHNCWEGRQAVKAARKYDRIKPVIHKTLPITQAEEAHAILQRRENIGKVVLTVARDGQERPKPKSFRPAHAPRIKFTTS